MYMILTDGSSNSAKVLYKGDMNNIREEEWHEWNILLGDEFQGVNPSLILSNISKVGIQFGGDIVAGGTDQFHTAFVGLVVGACTGKGGQEAMMDVDELSAVTFA